MVGVYLGAWVFPRSRMMVMVWLVRQASSDGLKRVNRCESGNIAQCKDYWMYSMLGKYYRI